MKEITIFRGATGLNTVEDPVRIDRQKNGLTDLQVAVNVSIDQSRRVNRRAGVSLLQSGSYHSLFCDGGDCFVVSDTTLYQVAADGSLSTVTTLTKNNRVGFAQSGERTYYANGVDKGYISGGENNSWVKGTYTGPGTNRQFSAPPAGHHLAVWGNRMLISQDNALWWSEPYNFNLYNLAESFVQFHSHIRMIHPVDAGIFVSTEKRTVFLRGLEGVNPKKLALESRLPYPAIEWSDASRLIDAADVGFQEGGLGVMWASPKGAVFGSSSGGTYNLNRDKVVYPDNATTGFGCMRGFNFIHGLN